MKYLLKQFVPAIFLRVYYSFKFSWKGDYKTWEEAQKECSGYDSEKIVLKNFESALKVSNGEYPYERDSVLFNEVTYSWPLSTALLYIAQKDKFLSVLDFGGGLGSSYFQNKIFTDVISDFRWYIVEQKKMVDIAKPLSSDKLIFKESISQVLSDSKINFVLFSSVLQYLPDPYSIIDEVLKFNPEVILFDRLSVVKEGRDYITKQTVDSSIYEGSYPCRFFNEDKFLEKFKGKYKLVSSFDSFVKVDGFLNFNKQVTDRGYFLQRI